jgi:hypothetical protein
VTAPERALYGMAYWSRRGEPDMVDQLAAALSPAERAEARAVMDLPGVGETLRTLSEDELRRRMYDQAGKSKEAHVGEPRREVTTILHGGPGVPTLIAREPGWEQQAAAEREAQRRAETAAEVKRIERERAIREATPRPPLVPTDPVAQVHAEWKRQKWLDDCAESRKWTPEFIESQLATEEVLLSAMRAQVPPPPDPVAERRRRDNEYSYGLAEWMAANR